jgi:hypothetical protein
MLLQDGKVIVFVRLSSQNGEHVNTVNGLERSFLKMSEGSIRLRHPAECTNIYDELRLQLWLSHHPRFHVYFTPVDRSWLKMVACLIRDPT